MATSPPQGSEDALDDMTVRTISTSLNCLTELLQAGKDESDGGVFDVDTYPFVNKYREASYEFLSTSVTIDPIIRASTRVDERLGELIATSNVDLELQWMNKISWLAGQWWLQEWHCPSRRKAEFSSELAATDIDVLQSESAAADAQEAVDLYRKHRYSVRGTISPRLPAPVIEYSAQQTRRHLRRVSGV
jgi:hypothetical protein